MKLQRRGWEVMLYRIKKRKNALILDRKSHFREEEVDG